MLTEQLGERRLIVRGQRADETGQHRRVITTPIEHGAHPLRGKPGVVDDRTVGVRSPGLLSNHRTLAMQSRQDRLHCRVGQLATDGVADLAGCERPVRRPQRRQDLRFQAAGRPPRPHHALLYHVGLSRTRPDELLRAPKRVLQ